MRVDHIREQETKAITLTPVWDFTVHYCKVYFNNLFAKYTLKLKTVLQLNWLLADYRIHYDVV